MKLLIGYASTHGSTAQIADHIGARLGAAGHDVTVAAVDEIGSLDGYEAVILASAVHGMAWLPQAASFARLHDEELARRPVWLVSVGSIGSIGSFFGPRMTRFMRQRLRDPKDVAELRTSVRPRGSVSLAGVIDRSHWGMFGNLFLRLCGGTFGDHRDWVGIDEWTDRIAGALHGPSASPETSMT